MQIFPPKNGKLAGKSKFMGNFSFNSRPGGPRGGFSPRDRNSGAPVVMHKATCSECGKPCEIPFVPSGDRPVYCSNCFEGKRRTGDPSRIPQRNFDPSRPPRRDFDRPSFSDRRPAFVPAANNQKVENLSNKEVVEQLISLNSKMDRLLMALEPKTPKKKVVAAVDNKEL